MGQQCAGVVRFAADSEAEAVTRRDDTMVAVVSFALVVCLIAGYAGISFAWNTAIESQLREECVCAGGAFTPVRGITGWPTGQGVCEREERL